MRPRDIGDLLMLGAIWGAAFVFMRVAVHEFGPLPLMAIRIGLGALFVAAVLAWRGGLGAMTRHAGRLTVLGAINTALPFSLFAYATLFVTAGFASILNASVPLFGAVVAYAWLGDRLPAKRVAGLAIGFLGVLILVLGRDTVSAGSGLAVLAGLAAAFSYGLAANYTTKKLGQVDSLVVATGNLIAAALMMIVPAVIFWPGQIPSTTSWLSALALAVLCTGVAYILFFRLISSVGPARAMTVTYLIPAFGIVWGALFLGEPITGTMIAASAVILLGTALATGTI